MKEKFENLIEKSTGNLSNYDCFISELIAERIKGVKFPDFLCGEKVWVLAKDNVICECIVEEIEHQYEYGYKVKMEGWSNSPCFRKYEIYTSLESAQNEVKRRHRDKL